MKIFAFSLTWVLCHQTKVFFLPEIPPRHAPNTCGIAFIIQCNVFEACQGTVLSWFVFASVFWFVFAVHQFVLMFVFVCVITLQVSIIVALQVFGVVLAKKDVAVAMVA